MKRYESDGYKARGVKGGYYLAKDGDSLEEMKQIIDESNDRAMKKGYKKEQWIIVHTEWYSWYDNDMFVKRETIETAVEVYPKEVS